MTQRPNAQKGKFRTAGERSTDGRIFICVVMVGRMEMGWENVEARQRGTSHCNLDEGGRA
jgi:hypothetical protein